MKLVYNLGGISHARDALRIDHGSYKQRSYTLSEKMQIVQAEDRLVEEENLPQNVHRLGLVKIYRLLRYNSQNNLPIPKICEYYFRGFS